MSRHAGLGPPQGGPRDAAALAADAIHAGPIDAAAVGYGGSRAMFETLAAEAARIDAPIFVDAILGRRGRGLYVPDDAVDAARRLLAQADVATPNDFELEALADAPVDTPARMAAAAHALRAGMRATGPRLVVVKRIDAAARRAEIRVFGDDEVALAAPLAPGRWRGTGDLFFGLFIGGTLRRAARPTLEIAAKAARDAAEWIASGLSRSGGAPDGDAPLDAILEALDAARQRHRKIGIAPSP